MPRRIPPLQPITMKQANRAADAAEKVGGYDKLIELERQRRENLRRKAPRKDKNK